jgi:hypothetical protein
MKRENASSIVDWVPHAPTLKLRCKRKSGEGLTKQISIKKKPSYSKASEGEGGAAGSRTPVQTRKSYAFYMLSPA